MSNKKQNKEENEEKKLLNKIEATLFLSAKFLSVEELVRFTGINPIMLRELLKKLESKYNENGGALTIIHKEIETEQGQGTESSYKMDIKPEFSFLVNKLASGESEFSKAEQETLAIIAYKQPIKQSIVVKIRGNKAYDHIKHFKQLELVRAKPAGRTYELELNKKFYDYFNLNKEKETYE